MPACVLLPFNAFIVLILIVVVLIIYFPFFLFFKLAAFKVLLRQER